MKFYHGKGSCSLGILVLLEEAGLPFELATVDLANGEQRSPAFLAVNPKGKVPLLQLDDGSTISEWPAIATYIALQAPAARLLPSDPLALARVYEAVDYMVATVHMQGFTRIVRPGNFAPSEADHDQVKARGREIFAEGLAAMAERLGERDYLFGDLSIADAALFYLENWQADRLGGELPPACRRHLDIMTARPAVARALAA